MKLADIVERRSAVETEMRGIYDAAESAGEDLAGEKLEKWNTLKAERDDLAAKEARARARDELDRQAEGRPIERAGEADGDTAFGLRPEQRMADYVRATTGRDAAGLSAGRAIRGMITGSWEGAELERRTMGALTGASGGYLLPDPISANIIDLMRNASVINRAGAITIPMTTKTLRLARVVTDPTPAWRSEGDIISESDGVFEGLEVVAHSLATLVRVNNELFDDAPNFASVLDNMLAQAMALKLDSAALYGSGVGQPLGLRLNPFVSEQSMGTNGATPTDFDKFLAQIADIEGANGNPTTLIYAPRTKAKLAGIVTGISSDKTKLQPPADFTALTKLVSNQISITETQGTASGISSSAFLGGFSNLAITLRQGITIETSRQAGTAFGANQTLVRAILRADVAVLRPNQISRLVGILNT